jgi:hypothetical protein
MGGVLSDDQVLAMWDMAHRRMIDKVRVVDPSGFTPHEDNELMRMAELPHCGIDMMAHFLRKTPLQISSRLAYLKGRKAPEKVVTININGAFDTAIVDVKKAAEAAKAEAHHPGALTKDGCVSAPPKARTHAAVIKAWADGADIQSFYAGAWREDPHPAFSPKVSYRLKPAPLPSADDLAKALLWQSMNPSTFLKTDPGAAHYDTVMAQVKAHNKPLTSLVA